jgi:hypothetical protein
LDWHSVASQEEKVQCAGVSRNSPAVADVCQSSGDDLAFPAFTGFSAGARLLEERLPQIYRAWFTHAPEFLHKVVDALA